MNFKKQMALLTVMIAFQLTNVEAAEIDDELAVIAAEQEGADVEIFNADQNSQSKSLNRDSKKKIDETPPVVEPVREEIDTSASETSKIETPKNEIPKVETPAEKPKVALPNPITNYTNFDALVAAVKFVPLYIPKKSGYTITSMHTISNEIAEVRYTRRWEPEVSLHIRTYKRKKGEELKDISGIHGVKWRVDMTGGTSVYIAKINEKSHVAAWSSGDYTLSAYVENISFAAFHSLVIDELVDLSAHYFIKIDD